MAPDLSVGAVVPGFERTVDLTRMVRYAAATWDWHRLHYDGDHASALGFPGPVVDGQMFGAFLAEQVLDCFGPHTVVLSISFRFRAMVFAGETVAVTGRVVSIHAEPTGKRVTVEQAINVGDRLCVTGTTVALVATKRFE